MVKTNKKKLVVVGTIALSALVIAGAATMYVTCPKRAVKEALCAESPEMCRCYKNIVDYRMSNREIAITNRFQREIKEFGATVGPVFPLEFATPEEIQHLNILLGICQMELSQRYARQQGVAPVQSAPVQQTQPTQQPVRK